MRIEKQKSVIDKKTINTIEEFELIPENIVSEYVDGRIRVFDSLTLEQHRLKTSILMTADDYLRKYHIKDKVKRQSFLFSPGRTAWKRYI